MKEKYSMDEKTHLAPEKNYLSIPWKLINGGMGEGGEGPNKLWGESEKNRKIKRYPPRLLGT